MAALILGLVSIVVWSSLALVSTFTAGLPPLFVVGVALCLGGLTGIFRVREWRLPLGTILLGVSGLFGYHALLFFAFRLAPALGVNLLNYLWPLLIVLMSPLLIPNTGLSLAQILGAIAGFTGAALIAGGGGGAVSAGGLCGYALAVAAAFVWAFYSLLTKRVRPFPTGGVGLFCALSGLLALGLWTLTEYAARGSVSLPRLETRELIGLALLGLGPMGGAFYSWDWALKHGDPRALGSLAYLTPLLSTFNLVVFGGRQLEPRMLVSLALIAGGAVLGASGLRARAERKTAKAE